MLSDEDIDRIGAALKHDEDIGMGEVTRADDREALLAEVARLRGALGPRSETYGAALQEARDLVDGLYNNCHPYAEDREPGQRAERLSSEALWRWRQEGWKTQWKDKPDT